MRAEAVLTLVGSGLLVAAVALYLALIAYQLSRVHSTLGTLIPHVVTIADHTDPVELVISSIATDVGVMDDALLALVQLATSATAGPRTRAALRPPAQARANPVPTRALRPPTRARVQTRALRPPSQALPDVLPTRVLRTPAEARRDRVGADS